MKWLPALRDLLHEKKDVPNYEKVTVEKAKEFARREDEIKRLVENINRSREASKVRTPYVSISSKPDITLTRENGSIGVDHDGDRFRHEGPLSGLGSGKIRFDRGYDVKLTPASLLGIDSDHVLKIWLHMDEETKHRAGGHAPKATVYFFGKDGKFGKLTALADHVVDRRKIVVREQPTKKGAFAQYVESEMTDADIDLVDEALTVLKTDLTTTLKNGIKPQLLQK